MGNTFLAVNRMAKMEHERFAQSLLQRQEEKKSNRAKIETSYTGLASSIRNEGFFSVATSVASIVAATFFLYNKMPLSQIEIPFQMASKFESVPTKLWLQPQQQILQKTLSLNQTDKQDLSSLEQRTNDLFYQLLQKFTQIATPPRG